MNIWYQCEYCGEIYETEKEALECEQEAKKKKPKFRINQIVMYEGYKCKIIGFQRPYCGLEIVDGEIRLQRDRHQNFYYDLVCIDPKLDLEEKFKEKVPESYFEYFESTPIKKNKEDV